MEPNESNEMMGNQDNTTKEGEGEGEEKENEETFNKLKCLFDTNNIGYKYFEHLPAKTSEEVAKLRNTPLETGAKAMIIKIDAEFVMFVIPADKKFNSKPAKKFLKTNCLRFANANELKELTHCLQGAVPPFGSLFSMKTYADESMMAPNHTYDYISFNGGLRVRSFQIKKEDYMKLEKPILVKICS